MEVILLKKMENLGGLGDIVRVKSGYARNYLVPQGKAAFATKDNLAEFELRRAELEKLAFEELTQAEQRRERLSGLSVTIPVKMATEDKIFGSVGNIEVIEAVKQASGEELQKKEIHLPGRAFSQLGTFQVAVALHADVLIEIELNIIAEK